MTEFEDRFEVVSDIGPFLEATRGLQGMVWDYTPTLRRLALRLYAPPSVARVDSYLVCVPIRKIRAPIDWDDSQFELLTGEATRVRLVDRKNDIEIDCGDVIGIVPKGEDWYFLSGTGL